MENTPAPRCGARRLVPNADGVAVRALSAGHGVGQPRHAAVRRLWCRGACLDRSGCGSAWPDARSGTVRPCSSPITSPTSTSWRWAIVSTAPSSPSRSRALAPVRHPRRGITRTLFVRRHWRSALIQRNALAARMRRGESFILFGEGTSSNGLSVRPIKTSLLSVAEPWILDCPIAVQPVTLVYARLADGTPIGSDNCDLYAWHSEAEFVPHLWSALQLARHRDPGPRRRSGAVLVGQEPQGPGPRTARPARRGAQPRTTGRRCRGRRRAPERARRRDGLSGGQEKRRREPPFQIGPACVGLRLVIHPF